LNLILGAEQALDDKQLLTLLLNFKIKYISISTGCGKSNSNSTQGKSAIVSFYCHTAIILQQ
jgi:hypothetical protein